VPGVNSSEELVVASDQTAVDIRVGSQRETLAEFAKQFSFPGYFGYNWNALNDCLNDLDWYAPDRILVRLDMSGSALDAEDTEILMKTLALAKLSWAAIGDKEFDYVVVTS
jgi:hypothetical protein